MDLQFGQYRLKRSERRLLGPGGPVELSARSFDILALLLGKPDEVIGKSEIFDAVWPGLVVEENTLQVHMSALRKTLDAGMITTVHGRGYKYAGPQPLADTSLSVKPDSPVLDRKPMVVVLPFVNLSGDPDQLFFSDGITEDIIDRLSKYRALQVINHQSSITFRGKPGEVLDTRDNSAADYILTGSIRKSEQRIRISARLTDARTERAIWADHYDRPLQNIFAIQDDVASIIASTLSGRVEIDVATRSPTANSGDISSYEHILQGVWHFKKLTTVENAIAAKYFEKAIAISPENAEAHRWLACSCSSAFLFNLVREDIETGRRVAKRSVELDPANARCHAALGFCQLWTDGLQAAIKSYRKALALNPDDPDVLIEMALCMVYAGDIAQAHEMFDQAFRLNPLPPVWYGEFRAIAAFTEGRYAEAISEFVTVTDGAWDTMYAMACYGHLEMREESTACRTNFQAHGRKWDLLTAARAEPFVHPDPLERLTLGLQKALAP